MRRRFVRRSARRRTVAWVPGVTTYDPTSAGERRFRLQTLASVGGTNTWGGAIQVTDDLDLSMHGGEDAVLTRIRGHLFFFRGRRDSGAGFAANAFPLRVVISQSDVLAAGTISPFEYTTSYGLGADNILFETDVIVSSSDPGVAGTGFDAIAWEGRHIDFDVKAKRKLQSDRHVYLWFQTAAPGGTTAMDFSFVGSLRTLIMRSR